ncbi:unnamed protein product [Cuscuta campestris]|uniref:Uncharacterized protein n=1 Tax=Cuscuta campestris TaxID=132261 RepID=A0A484L6Z6_9ASTE|nr:unnamed protein product [Cuscuta campestris]
MNMGYGRMSAPLSLPLSSFATIIIWTLCFTTITVSSSSSSSSSSPVISLGYEWVATAHRNEQTHNWRAPCFHENTATFTYDPVIHKAFVEITPHYGSCWTCRDDYQIRFRNKILDTGSTYFGGVANVFAFRVGRHDDIEGMLSEGVDIYVDKNPSTACVGVSKDTI